MIYEKAITFITFIVIPATAGYIGLKQPEITLQATSEPSETISEPVSEPPSIVEPPAPKTLKEIAKERITQEFGEDNWGSFDWIVTHESGWRVGVENPRSTAKGLCQLLKANRATYGVPDNATADDELNGCVNYIKARYSDPNNAKSFWKKHGWY